MRLISSFDVNLKLGETVFDLEIFVLQLSKGIYAQNVDNATSGRSKVNMLSQLGAEGAEYTETTSLIKPVYVNLLILVLRVWHLHDDTARSQDKHFVHLVTSLDDQTPFLVELGLQNSNDPLDDMVVDFSEVRDVLDHLALKLEVKIIVATDVLPKRKVDGRILFLCLLDATFLHFGEITIVS
jgi:hypothetical protein